MSETPPPALNHIPFDDRELAQLRSVAAALRTMSWLHFGVGVGAVGFVGLVAVANVVYLPQASPGTLTSQIALSATLSIGALFVGGLTIVQGRLLHRAQTRLTWVIDNDEADQAHMAYALARLSSFFICEALYGVLLMLLTWQAILTLLAGLAELDP